MLGGTDKRKGLLGVAKGVRGCCVGDGGEMKEEKRGERREEGVARSMKGCWMGEGKDRRKERRKESGKERTGTKRREERKVDKGEEVKKDIYITLIISLFTKGVTCMLLISLSCYLIRFLVLYMFITCV